MADESTATEQAGGEAAQPSVDELMAQVRALTDERDKAVEQSRKWETRSKSNADKAKAYDELAAQSMTDAEKLDAASKRAEEAERRLAEYEAERERAATVAEVAAAKGVDANLLSRMKGDTRKEVEENADLIASMLAGKSLYPSVNDGGQRSAPPITVEQIEAIKDPHERVMTRAKHIDLYRK